jgi:hypothetical protein
MDLRKSNPYQERENSPGRIKAYASTRFYSDYPAGVLAQNSHTLDGALYNA